MTTKLEQAARQALEALEYKEKYHEDTAEDAAALASLREALAEQEDEIDWIETNKALAKEIIELNKQAEQNPVAWFVQYKNRHEFVFGNKPKFIIDGVVEPLYAAPVRTKDLTDDEIKKVWKSQGCFMGSPVAFARAVIAADREKNK